MYRLDGEDLNYRPLPYRLDEHAIRAYYYTSVVGDDVKVMTVRQSLRGLGFEPKVFKRDKNSGKSKGVDIALAADFLCHAFADHYELAVLIAGDQDYLPLVEQVKRMGKIVCVAFFESEGFGLGPELRLAADVFVPLDRHFFRRWGQPK